MDLAKAWVTAVVVYLVGSAIMVYFAVAGNKVGQTELSTTSTILWNAVPALLIFMSMAVFSAIMHSPRGDDPARHALAVLLVPAVLVVFGIVTGLVQGFPAVATGSGAVASVAGTLAGWAVDRWRRGRTKPAAKGAEHGYY